MKNQLVLASGILCALSGVARAQTADGTPPAQSLKHYLRDNPMSLRMLDGTRPDGVRLFASPSEKRQTIYVEIVRKDGEAALRSLAAVLGARIVIDPEIKFLPPQTRSLTFNYVDEDVFEQVSRALVRSEAIETWKSAAGTYFFAAKAAVVPPPNEPTKNQQTESNGLIPLSSLQLEPSVPSRHPDPFVLSPGVWKPVVPQPSWEKREFNGHDFYWIPLPDFAKSQENQK